MTAELSHQNQDLLDAFLNASQSGEVAFRDGISTVPVWNGMLHFQDTTAVRLYIDALDSLEHHWDYTDEGIHDGTSQEITHLGDDALRAVDQAKGYNSLRGKYDLLCFQNFEYQQAIPFYIGDPEKKSILNEFHEVRIGSKIYKYVDDDLVAIIQNTDLTTLSNVRSFGKWAYGTQLSFYNEQTGIEVPSHEPEVDVRGACTSSLDFDIKKNIDGDYRTINLDASLFAGTTACGGVDWSVNWGDGNTTDPGGDANENHTYNVALLPGACQSFTITLTATLLVDCGMCPAGTESKEIQTVQICQPVPGCMGGNHTRIPKGNHQFTWNGNQYLIIGEIGQSNSSGLFQDRKLWSCTSFYKKEGGEWKSRKPDNNLGAAIFGWYYTNGCTTKSAYFEETEWKKKKSITVKKKPGQEFGTVKTGENVQVKGHFMASMEIEQNPFPALWAFELWKP